MGSTDHRNTCGGHNYLSGAVVPGVLIGAQLTYGKYRFQDHLWEHKHLQGASIATILGLLGEDMLMGIYLWQRPKEVGAALGSRG